MAFIFQSSYIKEFLLYDIKYFILKLLSSGFFITVIVVW